MAATLGHFAVDCGGDAATCLDVAASGEVAAVGDGGGFVHLLAATPHFCAHAFAPPTPVPEDPAREWHEGGLGPDGGSSSSEGEGGERGDEESEGGLMGLLDAGFRRFPFWRPGARGRAWRRLRRPPRGERLPLRHAAPSPPFLPPRSLLPPSPSPTPFLPLHGSQALPTLPSPALQAAHSRHLPSKWHSFFPPPTGETPGLLSDEDAGESVALGVAPRVVPASLLPKLKQAEFVAHVPNPFFKVRGACLRHLPKSEDGLGSLIFRANAPS